MARGRSIRILRPTSRSMETMVERELLKSWMGILLNTESARPSTIFISNLRIARLKFFDPWCHSTHGHIRSQEKFTTESKKSDIGVTRCSVWQRERTPVRDKRLSGFLHRMNNSHAPCRYAIISLQTDTSVSLRGTREPEAGNCLVCLVANLLRNLLG